MNSHNFNFQILSVQKKKNNFFPPVRNVTLLIWSNFSGTKLKIKNGWFGSDHKTALKKKSNEKDKKKKSRYSGLTSQTKEWNKISFFFNVQYEYISLINMIFLWQMYSYLYDFFILRVFAQSREITRVFILWISRFSNKLKIRLWVAFPPKLYLCYPYIGCHFCTNWWLTVWFTKYCLKHYHKILTPIFYVLNCCLIIDNKSKES